ncbi:MAG: hypothetical protein FD163_305 [Hyphomonadaceae bacterium]|nr:MAG: hypothetical protein FD128_148 [Hyphomonadaceae bacterium]KAF0187030.1 MAG: hypothetical protein FD163_305 [Hyphomonadaceae bacterium]
MENHAFPKPFDERECALGFCQGRALRPKALGLDKNLGREGIITEWA